MLVYPGTGGEGRGVQKLEHGDHWPHPGHSAAAWQSRSQKFALHGMQNSQVSYFVNEKIREKVF